MMDIHVIAGSDRPTVRLSDRLPTAGIDKVCDKVSGDRPTADLRHLTTDLRFLISNFQFPVLNQFALKFFRNRPSDRPTDNPPRGSTKFATKFATKFPETDRPTDRRPPTADI